jgi:hypothetical protein
MSEAVKIFLAYSREDTRYLDELRTHLTPLERSGKVTLWYDGKIEPGAVWNAEIKARLHDAEIVMLLVSASAIASDYFYEQEMKDALERHRQGKARVVPFILRPCAWHTTPLAELQAIPKDAKAVTTWVDRDEAYSDAVNRLWDMVINIENERILKAETEQKAREEKERKAEEEAELKRRQEEERKAKDEAELKRRQEEEQKAKEEAELKRRQEEERKAKDEAELKRKQDAEEKVHDSLSNQVLSEESARLFFSKDFLTFGKNGWSLIRRWTLLLIAAYLLSGLLNILLINLLLR